jgi:hypothetical protein
MLDPGVGNKLELGGHKLRFSTHQCNLLCGGRIIILSAKVQTRAEKLYARVPKTPRNIKNKPKAQLHYCLRKNLALLQNGQDRFL